VDVPYYADLGWIASDFAAKHNVYFGTSFDDVNDATVANPGDALIAEGTTDTTAAVDLELETIYYWRVDEVNSPPDSTVFKGDVWNFEVEPVAYEVAGVSAAASTENDPNMTAAKTVNGAGLNTAGQHGTNMVDMWLNSLDETSGASITYDLGAALMLDRMHVWNHNSQTEAILGYGIKEALIETSTDGAAWTELKTVELPQASGTASYSGDDVALDSVVAQYVRITALSNYSLLGLTQVGLAEVRFFYIPVASRELSPASGTTLDALEADLSWRSGRFTVEHQVLFSDDLGAVEDGSAVIATTADRSLTVSDLSLNGEYFWQIVDVTADGTAYPGPVQNLTVTGSLPIDDMEMYKAEEGLFIWEHWIDGFEDDDNGSVVGNGDDAETVEVYEGSQSLPMAYNNAAAPKSEATRTFDPPLDLTAGNPDSIELFFKGLAYEFNGYYSVEGTNWTAMSWNPQYVVMSEDALVGMAVTSHDAALETTAVYSNVSTTGNVTGDWTQADIGGTHPAGQFTQTNGTFAIKAMGADIWTANDEFRYVYKHLEGEGSITAQVDSLDPVNGWTKVGVMIRDTTETGASNAGVYATGVNGVRYQARLETGIDATSDTDVLDGSQELMNPPVWIRMERKPANGAAPIYMILTDSAGKSARIETADIAATQIGDWTSLSAAPGDLNVNLASIESITIGVGGSGVEGKIFIDYINIKDIVEPEGPSTEGLLALYEFEGDALDASGNGLDGTVTDGEFVDSGKPGMGMALQLNGAGNVDLGNPALLDFGTEDWTVAAWFNTNMTGTGDANKGAILAKGGDSGGGHRYALIMSESAEGAVSLVCDDNVTKVQAHATSATNDGEWHHVAGQRKGTSIHIYIDGMVEATSDVTAEYDLSGTVQHNAYIGAVTNNGDGTLYKVYYGLVDDVRIYHRALSAAEVLFLSGQ
jgi:hypothetical protein